MKTQYAIRYGRAYAVASSSDNRKLHLAQLTDQKRSMCGRPLQYGDYKPVTVEGDTVTYPPLMKDLICRRCIGAI